MATGQLQLYDKREQAARDQFLSRLEHVDTKLAGKCLQIEEDLHGLARIFDRYPSIAEERTLGGTVYSVDTLVDILYRDGTDHLALLPTRIAVGRGFAVAKTNFFGYLVRIGDQYQTLAENRDEIYRAWELGMFSLLVEDVYQVILEGEERYSPALRRAAARDLIDVWEYRYDRHVSDYATSIIELWRVRRRIAPTFGTMIGTREIMRLSGLLGERWYEFLSGADDDAQIVSALEEFIFGLSSEQIGQVRDRMTAENRTSIDRSELVAMLDRTDFSGIKELALDESPPDPRHMYRFYQRRRHGARTRALLNRVGPRCTIEELLLAYLIGDREQ